MKEIWAQILEKLGYSKTVDGSSVEMTEEEATKINDALAERENLNTENRKLEQRVNAFSSRISELDQRVNEINTIVTSARDAMKAACQAAGVEYSDELSLKEGFEKLAEKTKTQPGGGATSTVSKEADEIESGKKQELSSWEKKAMDRAEARKKKEPQK